MAISVDQLEQDGFIEPLLDGMCLAVGMDGDDCLFEGEGLPEIARLKGGNLYDMVDEITQRGMMKKEEGGLSWEEGFAARLELLRLTDGDIKNLEGIYASRITPHAIDVIRVLQLQGIQPLIISGGIRQAIVPVAALMGVSEEHVYANTLIPDEDGFYTRYDTTTPLAQGRKDLLVADIRRQRNFVGRLAMVGDGHMDMRAITGSGIKIGFCAYTPRDSVKEASHAYLTGRSFAAVAPLVLGTEGVKQLVTEYPSERGFILQGLRELQTHVVFNEAAIGFGENLQQLMHVLESEQEL